MRKALVVLVTVCVAAIAAPATAIVPPRDCGNTKIRTKTYNVKADQLSCRTAKQYLRNWALNRVCPKGYTCKRPPQTTGKLRYRCYKLSPKREVFGVLKS